MVALSRNDSRSRLNFSNSISSPLANSESGIVIRCSRSHSHGKLKFQSGTHIPCIVYKGAFPYPIHTVSSSQIQERKKKHQIEMHSCPHTEEWSNSIA